MSGYLSDSENEVATDCESPGAPLHNFTGPTMQLVPGSICAGGQKASLTSRKPAAGLNSPTKTLTKGKLSASYVDVAGMAGSVAGSAVQIPSTVVKSTVKTMTYMGEGALIAPADGLPWAAGWSDVDWLAKSWISPLPSLSQHRFPSAPRRPSPHRPISHTHTLPRGAVEMREYRR